MSTFAFKQFSIRQTHAAMKVGTDALLLGSLAQFDQADSLLDLGTGTGVLSLMIAQRYPGIQVTALECDSAACQDARFNFSRHTFSGCSFELVETDIRSWNSSDLFDAIVSNPPYFGNSFKSTDSSRNRARHTDDTLSFEELIRSVGKHLATNGTFWVILPHNEASNFLQQCENACLFVRNRVNVMGKPGHPVRVILAFKHESGPCSDSQLTVRDENGRYTNEYIHLTRDYHAKDLSAGK